MSTEAIVHTTYTAEGNLFQAYFPLCFKQLIINWKRAHWKGFRQRPILESIYCWCTCIHFLSEEIKKVCTTYAAIITSNKLSKFFCEYTGVIRKIGRESLEQQEINCFMKWYDRYIIFIIIQSNQSSLQTEEAIVFTTKRFLLNSLRVYVWSVISYTIHCKINS